MVKTKVKYSRINPVPQEDRDRIEEILKQQNPDHDHIHNYWRFERFYDGSYEFRRLVGSSIKRENIDVVVDFLSRYYNVSKD